MHKFLKGFTLIEILVVIAIVSILMIIVVSAMASFGRQQALKNTSDQVAQLITETRSKTLSSENGLQYGVHLDETSARIFSGPTYSVGSTIRILDLDSRTTLGTIALNGGGSDIVFARLTGETANYGTIIVSVSNASNQKTITISQTGIISSN